MPKEIVIENPSPPTTDDSDPRRKGLMIRWGSEEFGQVSVTPLSWGENTGETFVDLEFRLDRTKLNALIRALKKARNGTWGRDE